ncbi:M60 family metallopeptidase [Streptomyces sp. VRA16 Mangrove soil]|uniref:M60 family metallopeptidase n=1 Tax=Streptomyces sp. VRA16 Mangrove soil TaxID=2817434 RepID=UPI001A9F312E|nr:M60 family metallopeptidase [Streptomyces sp. VRA16 Mangrove soil]MBO1329734.1 M60 family metallopeptidase [Streptomyces sp. VRA16 Mangrove soil]
MRPARKPFVSPAGSGGPGRRAVLGALAGAGAATFLGASPAAAAAPDTSALHGGDTLRIKAFPGAESERLRLDRALRASDFIPTGRYAAPGAEVAVDVRCAAGVRPVLHIGTFDYYNTDTALQTPRAVELKPGRNTVTDVYGGPLYLSFAGHGQRGEVRFVRGAAEMAVFELGVTTEAEFQARLDAITDVPWVELLTDHAILTLTREGALLYRGEDHTRLMGLFDTVIDSHNRISGLDGGTRLDRPKAGRYHFNEVSVVPKGVGAYAWHGYNGFPRAYMDRLCTVTGLSTRGWGLYHELGHLNQQAAYQAGSLTEVTVNIYSLAAQRTLGQPSNLLTVNATTGLNWFQSARAKLGTAGLSYVDDFGAYEQLVPLRQLELAFGEDFWPRLHKLVRTEHQHDDPVEDYQHPPEVEARQYRALATYASRTAGRDLTDFFVGTWAMPIDAEGIARIAALRLPKPDVDPSSLTD